MKKHLNNLVQQLRQRATLWLFNKFYGHLVFGFETADKKIEKMTETQKVLYYEKVTDWVESDAYAIEDKSKIEDCYKKLSCEAVGEDIQTAYRLALLLMKNQDVRLRSKVEDYKVIKASKKAFNQVSNV